MILLNKTIRLFLDGIGRREEYEFYLDRFQSVGTPAFALVCPDVESVREASEMLVFDMQFLLHLGLVPVVVLAGRDAEAMAVELSGLGDACAVRDASAGEPVEGIVREAAGRKLVPALVYSAPLAETLVALAPPLARRVHFVRPRGALRTAGGEVIQYYYTRRQNPAEPCPEDEEVAAVARGLIEARPGIHVSVTSAINLLREIFTVKGAGTVIRRGRTVDHFTGPAGVDQPRLLALLNESFGKALAGETFLADVTDYYIEREYRGAALIEGHAIGHYLSKFAVGTEARGEGLAQELWQELAPRHPALFWRSRESNPINQWYERKADGRHRIGGWQVFWRGLEPAHIAAAIAYCQNRPTDFRETAS